MAISTEQVTTTRSAFRARLRHELEELLEPAVQKVPDGDFVNVPVVTEKDLREAIATTFGAELPPPDEHTVEATTPVTLFVSAICPRCHLPGEVTLEVHAQLVVDEDGTGELQLKAKSKSRTHVCGQLAAFPRNAAQDGPGQERARQVALDLGDAPVEDDAGEQKDFEPTPAIVHDLLLLVLPAAELPSIEVVEGWDEPTRLAVGDWAAAVHLRASDHREVSIPEKPAILGGDPEPASPGGPDPDAVDDPDDVPF